MINNIHRYVVVFLFIAVMAGTWDVWWHGNIGRETLFEPPHLLLYSSVILAIFFGIYGYVKTKSKLWKRLAILLMLVPISAPFDELWHRIFGVEDISTIWAVWSPPHVILILAVIGSFALVFPIINKEKDIAARRLFGVLSLAGILSLLLFLVSPLEPIGPWGILGFYGAGIVAFMISLIFLITDKKVSGIGAVTLMTVFLILLSTMSFSRGVSEDIKISPHDHAPTWLTIFSIMLPALFLDKWKRMNNTTKGLIVGLLWSGILFGFSWMFFEEQFIYTFNQGVVAIISSGIGGLIAGKLIK